MSELCTSVFRILKKVLKQIFIELKEIITLFGSGKSL